MWHKNGNCQALGEFEIENGDDDGKSPSAAADGKSIGKFLRMDTDGGECTIKADDDDGGAHLCAFCNRICHNCPQVLEQNEPFHYFTEILF